MEDILILGDQWTLNVFVDAFLEQGVSPQTKKLSTPFISPIAQAVFVGNGDTHDQVAKTMGEELSSHLWNLSELNYTRAIDFP